MLRVLVKRGGDPMADKRQAEAVAKPTAKVKVPTFADCGERYIESHRAGRKNDKHIAQWESTLRMYADPAVGKKAVDTITVEHVLTILKPIWTEKPEIASRRPRTDRACPRLGSGYGSPERRHPAQWKGGALSHLLPPLSKVQKVEHHKAVPYAELPQLMTELRKNGSVSAWALMFTILTVARTSETTGAERTEVDRKQKPWVVPPERMKAGREHRVPLTDAALALIDNDASGGRYLFPNPVGRRLSNMAILQLLRGLRDDGSVRRQHQ